MGVMPSASTSLIAQYYCPKSHQGCTFIPSLCRFKNDFHHALISVDPCWVGIHSQHEPQKNMQWMNHHLTLSSFNMYSLLYMTPGVYLSPTPPARTPSPRAITPSPPATTHSPPAINRYPAMNLSPPKTKTPSPRPITPPPPVKTHSLPAINRTPAMNLSPPVEISSPPKAKSSKVDKEQVRSPPPKQKDASLRKLGVRGEYIKLKKT